VGAKKKLVIIDGNSVFYRGYYAMPNLATKDGKPTGGVYGFAILALQILKKFNPDHVIVAWDKAKTSARARKKIYPQYKAGRKPMPDDMREQIPLLRQLLDGFNWPLVEVDDYEADDVMGALAVQAKAEGIETTLISSDLDLLQLVQPLVHYCVLKKGLTDIREYDDASIKAEFGFSKEAFDDYKALKGDASDNIPGVPGVGPKTAQDLVQKYKTLEKIYANLDDFKGALRANLENNKEMAFLSRELVHIMTDAPVKLDLKSADATKADSEAIAELFQKLQFKRLVDELPVHMQRQVSLEDTKAARSDLKVNVRVAKDVAALKAATVAKELVIYTITEHDPSSQLPVAREMVISASPREAVLVRQDLVEKVAGLLKGKRLIGHNIKRDLKASPALETAEIFDVLIAGFLINPLNNSRTLAEFASSELGIEFIKTAEDTPVSEDNAGLMAAVIWGLYKSFSKQLKTMPKVQKLAQNVEFPMIKVLADMESLGILLDSDTLVKMSADFKKKIAEVQGQIFTEAKAEFNISSPAQLQTVLFETLDLPTQMVKRTKTGYSTAASELEKLRKLHPIINMISTYRELTKLKSTYIDALPKLVDSHSRLHTTFNILGSQTGRLSSENPNLMNIPVRTELGREIRRAFVADKGNQLISVDYSQFELRLAAVLAGDKNMIHAFNKGIDIHAMTAAELYDVEIDMVTRDQRSSAKTVNFGVLYGMSPHGLSVATGMSRDKAQDFIKRYFEVRQDLVKYLDELAKKAKKDGYVETLFGRRRPMPDINSSNFVVREAAKRAAINMPIQGTEADLMKMAMIEIAKKLDRDCPMLLQIHDSILIEAPKSKAAATGKLAEQIMENIYKLPVKLEVDVKIGSHWGEL
jgi:DNA polymerase I